MDAFDGIKGQPKVRDYLRKCVTSDKVSQSYLFLGPQGSNKMYSALCLAAAHLCGNENKLVKGSNCGKCDFCSRIFKGKFIDVHVIEPEGNNGYMIEQIRSLIADINLAPVEASSKVYIIDRVDLMGTSCANAFLKTLEEPPDNTLLILLGRTKETVLPTIVSRCNCVPFRHIPPSEAALIVANKTGKDKDLARVAIYSCGGSITKAIDFLDASGASMLGFRQDIIDILKKSVKCDAWEVCKNAVELVLLVKAPCDSYLKELEKKADDLSEFLDTKAKSTLATTNKRMVNRRSAELISIAVNVVNSVLIDVSNRSGATCDDIINYDIEDFVDNLALRVKADKLDNAMANIESLKSDIKFGVSTEVFFDNLLIYFRGVFK